VSDPTAPKVDAAVPPLESGLKANLKYDLLSGFLVFLIALPLCLAIAQASGYPPIAGVWTAVLGGLITTFISNSEMTIKGPAAGMIVIVLGSVVGFEADIKAERVQAAVSRGLDREAAEKEVTAALAAPDEKAAVRAQAYRWALGVGVVAGIIQILFGLCRAASLAELCPMTPIHGLLASIGIVIMFKSGFTMLGLKAPGGAGINSVIEFPGAAPTAFQDPVTTNVAVVGLVSLALIVLFTQVKIPYLKKIPGQVLVLVVAVPLAIALGVPKAFLIPMPDVVGDPQSAFAVPDFGRLLTRTGITYIILFAMIGSLESVLSAKAVDLLDPWRRKTNLNRDILGVGVANTVSSAVGGLPNISEIVRSKANIDNGARTRFADFFHALFLLVAVLALTPLIALFPSAALAALLVFVGYRLAHPREFVHAFKVGPEQLVVFLVTLVTILFTDLLKGFAVGVVLEAVIHLVNGASVGKMAAADVEVVDVDAKTALLRVRGAAVFTNWLGLRKKLLSVGEGRNVVVDLSETTLVDHTVMDKLHGLEREFAERGRTLEVRGLDEHKPLGADRLSARKRRSSDAAVKATTV
jgi:MFS superfamily sulfate permease-like transporter